MVDTDGAMEMKFLTKGSSEEMINKHYASRQEQGRGAQEDDTPASLDMEDNGGYRHFCAFLASLANFPRFIDTIDVMVERKHSYPLLPRHQSILMPLAPVLQRLGDAGLEIFLGLLVILLLRLFLSACFYPPGLLALVPTNPQRVNIPFPPRILQSPL